MLFSGSRVCGKPEASENGLCVLLRENSSDSRVYEPLVGFGPHDFLMAVKHCAIVSIGSTTSVLKNQFKAAYRNGLFGVFSQSPVDYFVYTVQSECSSVISVNLPFGVWQVVCMSDEFQTFLKDTAVFFLLACCLAVNDDDIDTQTVENRTNVDNLITDLRKRANDPSGQARKNRSQLTYHKSLVAVGAHCRGLAHKAFEVQQMPPLEPMQGAHHKHDQVSRGPHTETQETQEPPGTAETQDPVGTAETQDPMGTAETQEPMGTAETQDPMGTAETQEPVETGTEDTQDPTGTAETKEPVETQEPVGIQEPVVPMVPMVPVVPVVPVVPAVPVVDAIKQEPDISPPTGLKRRYTDTFEGFRTPPRNVVHWKPVYCQSVR